METSERGHVDYVERVLQTGIDVDHVNSLGWNGAAHPVRPTPQSRRADRSPPQSESADLTGG